ncbi:MAG: hypothetical protein QM742_13295 [Aquabacterium sp.]
MIARPIHRPQPIPFDAPAPSSHGASTRSVSWSATLGVGAPAPAIAQVTPSRLSPVKAPLPASTAPRPKVVHTAQAAQRSTHAHTSMQAPKPGSTASTAHVGGPRHHQNNGSALTEISARYIGHGALSVRSSVTGRHYRFQGHGDSLVIDRNDVVLLKRISDLVIR